MCNIKKTRTQIGLPSADILLWTITSHLINAIILYHAIQYKYNYQIVYTYIYMYICVYMYIYVSIYISIYIHIHIDTYILIYIYIHEGESKSKGKNTFNGFNRNNCEQFYISFSYIVPLQHNAFVILFNQFLYSCREEAFRLLFWSCVRDVDGRPERPSSVGHVACM